MKTLVGPILSILIIQFFSCTNEDSIEQQIVIANDVNQTESLSPSSTSTITTITFDDFKKDIEHSSNYQKLAEKFDVNVHLRSKNSRNNDADIILDTEYINKMEDNGHVSYTLRVENDKKAQNIVIESLEDSLELKLYTYDFLDKIEVDDESITMGSVNIQSIDKEDISNLSRNGCYPVTFGFPYPCDGIRGNGQPANHHPGDSCSADQGPGYIWYTTTVCPGGGGSPGFGAPLKIPRECTALQCPSIEGNSGGGGSSGPTGGGGGFGDGTTPIIDDNGNSLFDIYLQGAISLLDNRLKLSFHEENWLKYNSVKMQEIIDFLHLSNWSSESKNFAKESIRTLIVGGEVDFENEVLIDESFKNTKADCVLKKLLDQTGYFKEVMDAFTNNNSDYRIKFTTGAVRDGADAQTSAPDANGIITITFRPSSANAKDLEIAGYLLHEGVHAQLYRVLASGNKIAYNLSATEYDWLLELNEWWKDESKMPAETAQHDFMSELYVNPIANAVRKFDSYKHSKQNYLYFGWEGLYDEGGNRGLINMSQYNELIRLARIPLNDNHKTSCEK